MMGADAGALYGADTEGSDGAGLGDSLDGYISDGLGLDIGRSGTGDGE